VAKGVADFFGVAVGDVDVVVVGVADSVATFVGVTGAGSTTGWPGLNQNAQMANPMISARPPPSRTNGHERR